MNIFCFSQAERHENCAIGLFLFSILFFALAWMAILPPYEGMDEIGHYASIRHVAETLSIPFPGSSFLPQETLDYGRAGPLPYSPTNAQKAQFKGLTYPDFFNRPDLIDAYKQKYRSPMPRASYAPSTEDDWQAQHPPLYYLLMAPLMKATDFLPFVTQFYLLRLASFLLALGGMIIGLRASLAKLEGIDRQWIIRGTLLYPLLVPIFIQEFARLGNDSLCLLLTGCVWASFTRWQDDQTNIRKNLALGTYLGLGLLTKALFLPLLAGFISFFLLRLWRGRCDSGLTHRRTEALKAFMLPVILGGLWYVHKLKSFGVISGSIDEIYLAQHGGLLHGLAEHFTWSDFGKGWLISLLSWFGSGTASQVSLFPYGALPFLLLTTVCAVIYILNLRRGSLPEALKIQAWLYGALFIGLFYFELVCTALGTDHTPGWYLNIMLPFAAPLYALGLQDLWKRKWARLLCQAVPFYAVIYLVCTVWSDMTLYAGCSIPTTEAKFEFSTPLACLDQIGLVLERLKIIAFPEIGLLCLVGGCVCAAGGSAVSVISSSRRKPGSSGARPRDV